MPSINSILENIETCLEQLPKDVSIKLSESYNKLRELIEDDISNNSDLEITEIPKEKSLTDHFEVFELRLDTEKKLKLMKMKLSLNDYKFDNLNILDDLIKNDINESQEELNKLELTNESLKINHKNASTLLLEAKNKRKDKVGVIEKKVQDLSNSIFMKEGNFLVIKYLLEKRFVRHPLYDIITEMKEEKGVNSIDQLSSACNVNKSRIIELFKDLRDEGIMSYDENRYVDNFRFVKEIEY
jgi:hypothetical protein